MVILNRLEAHNFRKLNITLDFPQGMLIIKGPNEAGKSTILEAILYALFGKLMRGTKELAINHQSNIAKIKLTFTVNGQQYLVQRILKRTETHAKIYKITSNGLVPQALTVQETNKFIKNLLGGLSFNEVLVTNIVAQKELDKLLELKGQSREKIINALLGLESYNKAIEKIAEERREKGRELEAKKDKLSEIEKRLEAYRKDLKELKEKQQKLKDNEQEFNEKNKKLEEKRPIYLKLREYREALNQKHQLEAELKGVENVTKQLKQNLENLENQIGEKQETLNKTIEEVLEENDRLEKYKNLEKTKELLKEAEKRFKELQELENNKQTLLNGLKKLKEELKRLKEKQESKETKEILKREEELQQKLEKTKISPIMFFLLLLPSILALISFPLIVIGPLVVTAYIFYITKIRSSLQQELIKIKDKVIE
ncbi:MAG: AAA family ATPase, partial [Candidatus Odinarchaeota archaeon]|nr:AAA family ATPase [Candidatus Odinarchaeota archaeon]